MSSIFFFFTLHIQQLLKIWHRLHRLIRTWFRYITIAFAGRPLSIGYVLGEHSRWSGRISRLRLRSGGKSSLRRSTVTGIQFASMLIFLGLPQGWMFVYSCARAKSQGILYVLDTDFWESVCMSVFLCVMGWVGCGFTESSFSEIDSLLLFLAENPLGESKIHVTAQEVVPIDHPFWLQLFIA